LVFLASHDSTTPGSYALTELKYARVKWRHPNGRVLPVRIGDVSWEAIPNYLKAVTVLEPEGNVGAEVVLAVSENARSAGKRKNAVVVATIGLVGVLGASVLAANWQTIRSLTVFSAAPRSCANMIGYPKGMWTVDGVKVEKGSADCFNQDLNFTGDNEGTWFAAVGQETPGGTFATMAREAFSAEPAPAPGKQVLLTFTSDAPPYSKAVP
jgi:hypothetical protein